MAGAYGGSKRQGDYAVIPLRGPTFRWSLGATLFFGQLQFSAHTASFVDRSDFLGKAV
jgi:hypothetical protein